MADRFAVEVKLTLPDGSEWSSEIWLARVPGVDPPEFYPDEVGDTWFRFLLLSNAGLESRVVKACENAVKQEGKCLT